MREDPIHSDDEADERNRVQHMAIVHERNGSMNAEEFHFLVSPRLLRLNLRGVRTPDLADMDARKLLLAAVDQVDQGAGNDDGSENRSPNAQAVHHSKAANRAGTKDQERQTGDQARYVRVQNRGKSAFIALTDSGLRLSSDAQFFTNTFVNQHVRVNGHTERKRDSRNTRQRERCLQHRQNRNQHHDVADQRYGTHHTKDLIVDRHENGNHNEAVKR